MFIRSFSETMQTPPLMFCCGNSQKKKKKLFLKVTEELRNIAIQSNFMKTCINQRKGYH